MTRILFMIFTCISLSSASSLDPRYNLMRTSIKSDDIFANVISEINEYIKDKKLDVHKLGDFPLKLPFAYANFSNGQMGDFSTIELHKSSILPQSVGKLCWTLAVGLGEFSLKYDLVSDLFNVFKNAGNLKMTVPKSNILLSGIIDVSSPQCSTTLEIVTFTEFPIVYIDVQPLSIKNWVLKHLFEFAVNHSKFFLSSTLNSYLKEFILYLIPPTKINEIMCKYLNKFPVE